jgi:hypothetical protein
MHPAAFGAEECQRRRLLDDLADVLHTHALNIQCVYAT